MKEVKYLLQGLDCANCAMKIEKQLNKMEEIESASVDFATLLCVINYKTYSDEIEEKVKQRIVELEDEVVVIKKEKHHHEHHHEEECSCGHEHHHEHHHEEGCDCGHEHHHEHHHEEECSCGHEHHHEHHHEEECGCGHEHHHEHHHEEECGCGHEHHHEHEAIEHHEAHYTLQGLDCANCAMKIEKQLNKMAEVENAVVDFATLQCTVKYKTYSDEAEKHIIDTIIELEDEVQVIKKDKPAHHHDHECSCGHDHDHETISIRPQTGKNRWKISGLDCANCALKIEDKLNTIDGIKQASLNFTTGTLLFDIKDGYDEKHVKTIMKQTIKEMEDEAIVEETETKTVKKASDGVKQQLIPIIIGAILLIIGLMIKDNSTLSFAFYLAAYLVTGWKVLKKAIKNIRRGEIFDENFLMGIATIGALIIGEYTEAIAVLIFYEVGEMFQSFSVGKSRESIANLMNIKSEIAHLVKDGKEVDVHPETVKVNDLILVKPGERIPLDGIVASGNGTVDTSALTGESLPAEVEEGSEVMAGCVNLNSVIQIKVSKPYGESTVSRILELVENASSKKAVTEQKITSFARIYTPIVCGLAVAIALIPQFFNTGYEWTEWISRACTFLVISCPCALVLSVPLGYFAGIGAASKKGVLIKGGNYLEVLKDLDTIVFDKTGTLTTGTFSVTEIVGENETELLHYAALAECYSTHPIAQSIVKRYGKAIDKSEISDVEEIAGHGVSVVINNEHVYAGNIKLMNKFNIEAPTVDADGTMVYVAKENQYLGYLVIADTIKPSTKSALAELKKLGIKKTVMLTGDREKTAANVAKQVGIDEVHAQLLPTDKVSEIEKILANGKNGKVAFVGDGINDAPVLARCDLGIAMGGIGSEAAIEAADIVLMKDNIDAISDAIRVAKKTQKIMNQNITFVLAIKLIILILGAIGYANMWMGVFADVGVAVLAILNSMRILK